METQDVKPSGHKAWTILILVILGILTLSFAQPTFTRISTIPPSSLTSLPLPTIQPRPLFVEQVVPPEGSTVPIRNFRSEFQSEICADIDFRSVVEPFDNLFPNDATERIRLVTKHSDVELKPKGALYRLTEACDATGACFPAHAWFCWPGLL